MDPTTLSSDTLMQVINTGVVGLFCYLLIARILIPYKTHDERVDDLKKSNVDMLNKLQDQHEKTVAAQDSRHQQMIDELKQQHDKTVEAVRMASIDSAAKLGSELTNNFKGAVIDAIKETQGEADELNNLKFIVSELARSINYEPQQQKRGSI